MSSQSTATTTAAQTVSELKRALRKLMRQKLKTLSRESVQEQSQWITQQVLAMQEYKAAKRVSIFLSMDGPEVSTDAIIQDLLQRSDHPQVYIPQCVTETRMEMVLLRSIEDLKTLPLNSMGIREPPLAEEPQRATALPPPPAAAQDKQQQTDYSIDRSQSYGLDLILMPGMAFDTNGWRMGYGRGYYDRFLQRCEEFNIAHNRPKTLTVALALREQVLSDGQSVPRDEFDVKPDRLIVPS